MDWLILIVLQLSQTNPAKPPISRLAVDVLISRNLGDKFDKFSKKYRTETKDSSYVHFEELYEEKACLIATNKARFNHTKQNLSSDHNISS